VAVNTTLSLLATLGTAIEKNHDNQYY